MLDHTSLKTRPHDGSHLTTSQVEAIETYMARLLRELDLAHWRVYVAADLPPEDCIAMIQPTDGRRIAMLYISEDWWTAKDAEEKRLSLLHEALHLTHHDTDTGIRQFMENSGDIAEYVKYLVMTRFKLDLERMVDSLSYVLAPHMPEWSDA